MSLCKSHADNHGTRFLILIFNNTVTNGFNYYEFKYRTSGAKFLFSFDDPPNRHLLIHENFFKLIFGEIQIKSHQKQSMRKNKRIFDNNGIRSSLIQRGQRSGLTTFFLQDQFILFPIPIANVFFSVLFCFFFFNYFLICFLFLFQF